MRSCPRRPPRRPRRLLRLRGAARRPVAARPAGRGRRRGGAWRRATRRARSACGRRWAAARRGGCARDLIVVAAAHWEAYRGGEPGGAGGVRGDAARGCRRCRSTRRSSTSREAGRRAARGRASGSAREVRARVGLPITVGVARTRLLAKMAGAPPSRTGCGWSSPRTRRRSCTRCALEQLWGLGPASARKLHARGLRTIGDLAELRRARAGGDPRPRPGPADPPPGRATAATRPARAGGGAAGASFGAQSALGRPAARRRRSSTRRWTRVVRPGDEPDAQARGRVGRTVVLRLRFGDYSRATRSHTLPHATAEGADGPDRAARPARGGDARGAPPGPHARRRHGRQPRRRRSTPGSSRSPSTDP